MPSVQAMRDLEDEMEQCANHAATLRLQLKKANEWIANLERQRNDSLVVCEAAQIAIDFITVAYPDALPHEATADLIKVGHELSTVITKAKEERG